MILNYEFDDEDYEYDASWNECRFIIKKELNKMTKEDLIDFILNDIDSDEQLEEYFEEDIKDYYYDDACECYKDSCEYNKDPYAYYGVSHKDFC